MLLAQIFGESGEGFPPWRVRAYHPGMEEEDEGSVGYHQVK